MSQPPYPSEPPVAYDPPYYPAYATPPEQGPTAPKVIGITGTILGSLGVLSLLLAVVLLVALVTVPALAKLVNRTNGGASNTPLAWGMSFALGLTWIVELAASIGVLRRAEWGRSLLVGWAVVYPVLLLVSTAINVVILIPRTVAQTPTPPNMPPGFVAAMAYGSVVVGVALRLVFPPFVLVYLRRPAVRAWFA